jgi:uncharacterized protein (TIGR03382 family)
MRSFVAALALLPLIACSSSQPASTDDVGTTSEALSTSDAVSRAEQWVAVKLHYCQAPNGGRDYDGACSTYCNRYANPAWDPYRSDCSGLVSWAWGLPPPGRVTGQFAPFQNDITKAIQATDLQEGDAVNNSEHVMLFKAWVTHGSRATFLEEPGCSVSTPYAHEVTSDVTISGTSIQVAYNGMTFTAIRYGALAAPDLLPKGYLDGATCDALHGWAQDPNAAATAIGVNLYFDGPKGLGPLTTKADVHRDDLCKAIGSCDHGFDVAVPVGLMDGAPHTVYAYGVDSAGKTTSLLSDAPKTFTCAAPAIPAGVKRGVTGPSSMTAWKFDPALDVAHQAQGAVDTVPKGDAFPDQPTAVIADDGSPAVWVVDGAVRRHVVSPASLAAWQLTTAKWSAAKIDALAQGPDWPASPFVFKGDGAAVYVLDVAPGAPPPGAPAPQRGGDAPSASSGGCDMGGAPGSSFGPWLVLLGLAGLSRRRR